MNAAKCHFGISKSTHNFIEYQSVIILPLNMFAKQPFIFTKGCLKKIKRRFILLKRRFNLWMIDFVLISQSVWVMIVYLGIPTD
ncbi:MAG: hypothetical protein LBL74_02990 [Bacteroidales bacterium]|nr:hypothetical protein [Bacteroidales bacterium]